MATYQDIRRQVENLTPDEQLCLLEELAAIVRRHMALKPKRSIMELEGLGQEIWQGIIFRRMALRKPESLIVQTVQAVGSRKFWEIVNLFLTYPLVYR